jgi:pimeloyl-ACP methyl ester carboxylesterase
MDFESPESRALGCWDGPSAAAGLVDLSGDLSPKPDFEPGDAYRDFLMDIGYGKSVTADLAHRWGQTLKETYSGDDGKRRICAAAVCLSTRDGLHKRLPQIRCPVLWLQGTGDVVFSFTNAEAAIKLFTNSPGAKLVKMEDGVHFLSFTHQEEVRQNILDFTREWAAKQGVANL